jgi:hypothetical protein
MILFGPRNSAERTISPAPMTIPAHPIHVGSSSRPMMATPVKTDQIPVRTEMLADTDAEILVHGKEHGGVGLTLSASKP